MSFFTYNPKNHCWPAVIRAVATITTGTILMSICEALTLYELESHYVLYENTDTIFYVICAFVITNAFILRKYVRILRTRSSGDIRFIAYAVIGVFSFILILTITRAIFEAWATEVQSQTLKGIDFCKGDYFRIANPGCLDTTRIGHDIERKKNYTRHSVTLTYKGYYVIPFHDCDSVFYAIKYEHSKELVIHMTDQERKNIWKQFARISQQQRNSLLPKVDNHLFHRIIPSNDSPFWVAAGYSYAKDSVCHDINSIHRSILLMPVKSDVMPEWQSRLHDIFGIIGCFIALLALLFSFSKTDDIRH